MRLRALHGEFGVAAVGVDAAQPLDAATVAALRAAFDRHRILVLRDQQLPPAAQVAFSRHFGEFEIHLLDQYHKDRHPEIFELSNIGPDGRPNAVHPDRGTLFWHSDASWQAKPALCLRACLARRRPGDVGQPRHRASRHRIRYCRRAAGGASHCIDGRNPGGRMIAACATGIDA